MGLLEELDDLFSGAQREKDDIRTQQMEALARHLGWSFLTIAILSSFIPYHNYFFLFSQGWQKKLSNLLYHDGDQLRVAIFDFEFLSRRPLPQPGFQVTIGGEVYTYAQTVFYLRSPKLDLPPFDFFHQYPGDILNNIFSNKDYEIEMQERIRSVFNERVLSFYDKHQNIWTEGNGNQLFFYRVNTIISPDEMLPWLNLGLEAFNLFQKSR